LNMLSWPAGVRATQLRQTANGTTETQHQLAIPALCHLGGPHLRAMTLAFNQP
jgi:hypothetical protein